MTANNEPSQRPSRSSSNENPKVAEIGTPRTQKPIIVNIDALAYLPIPIIKPLPIPPMASNNT